MTPAPRWELPRVPWRGIALVLHRLRWSAGWGLMRIVLPAIMTPIQSGAWCRGWRKLVDYLVRWPVQTPAALFAAACCYLFGGTLLVLALLTPAWIVLAFGAGRLIYPHTFRGRCRARYHPAGWADWHDLRRGVSAHAMRQAAVKVRPALRARVTGSARYPSATRLARVPAAEVGLRLGKTAIGSPWPTCCYAAHHDTVGIIAPPQSVKTAIMGDHLLDHDGAALSTQTKPGTYHDTAALRARVSRSGRVELLDPEGLTGDKSTFRYNPVRGCAEPRIAQRTATALATAADGDEGVGQDHAWFAAKAADVLRAFLLIADVAGATMDDVYLWAAGGQREAEKAVALMKRHRGAMPRGWLEAMGGAFATEAKKTRDSIMSVLEASVAFMADPNVAELCRADDDEPVFDVPSFLADRGTVYLIASNRRYAKVGPLLAAFTTMVFDEAKDIAVLRPGHRLDPTLLLSLDEVALTIPMPLDEWVADAGGRGITIEWSAQSPSQLRQRWGDDGADTVWNATTVKLVGGGLTVHDDLRHISELFGERFDTDSVGEGQRAQKVPVMSPDDLRRLPPWHVAMIHRSTGGTLLRVRPVYWRADVIAAKLLPRTPPPPPAAPLILAPPEPTDAPREHA
jgi:type IV secretory pathway TraG/TraD family ATPase VirD4